jgi:hypothetical protein
MQKLRRSTAYHNARCAKMQGLSGVYGAHNLNKQKLSSQHELDLVDYIKELSKRGLPPTKKMTRRFASEIGNCHIGNGWVGRFLRRNKQHLTLRWTKSMDAVCHKADSEANYELCLDLLHQKMEQYGIELRHTYYMDEKGFLIGAIGKRKRIFSKVSWDSKEARAPIQDGSREWITVLAAVCADGEALPPSLIYQAERGNV